MHLQNSDCLTALLDLLQTSFYQTTDPNKIVVLAQCCGLITLLLDSNNLPVQIDVLLGELSSLFKNCDDAQMLYNVCGSLCIIAEGGFRWASAVISSGVVPRLAELLRYVVYQLFHSILICTSALIAHHIKFCH